MTSLLFYVFAVLTVVSAAGVIAARSPIYSAMSLVGTFFCLAGIYVLLLAHTIAVLQVLVYAGAIMVLFLFVIMLLGGEQLPLIDPLRGQRLVAALIGIAFLAEIMLYIVMRGDTGASVTLTGGTFATPAAFGMLLFSRYLLPFEITSIILLTAVIGAVFLTRTAKLIKDEPARLAKE